MNNKQKALVAAFNATMDLQLDLQRRGVNALARQCIDTLLKEALKKWFIELGIDEQDFMRIELKAMLDRTFALNADYEEDARKIVERLTDAVN